MKKSLSELGSCKVRSHQKGPLKGASYDFALGELCIFQGEVGEIAALYPALPAGHFKGEVIAFVKVHSQKPAAAEFVIHKPGLFNPGISEIAALKGTALEGCLNQDGS